MARPKKTKVVEAEQHAGDHLVVAADADAVGGGEEASPRASEGSDEAPAPTAHDKRFVLPHLIAYNVKSKHAQQLRLLADNEQKQMKQAQRLHDAKMKRLDAGDKRNRRKNPFRAACRTYETIIELLEAKLKCEQYLHRAAEAEAAAARAEVRLCRSVL